MLRSAFKRTGSPQLRNDQTGAQGLESEAPNLALSPPLLIARNKETQHPVSLTAKPLDTFTKPFEPLIRLLIMCPKA